MKLTCRKCGIKEDEKEFDSINTTTQAGTCLRCANLQMTARNYGGNKTGQKAGQPLKSGEHGGDMKTDSPLVNELYQHKEKTGITNDDLARAIGVRTKTLQRLFNGHTKRMHTLTEAAIEDYLAQARRRQRNGK